MFVRPSVMPGMRSVSMRISRSLTWLRTHRMPFYGMPVKRWVYPIVTRRAGENQAPDWFQQRVWSRLLQESVGVPAWGFLLMAAASFLVFSFLFYQVLFVAMALPVGMYRWWMLLGVMGYTASFLLFNTIGGLVLLAHAPDVYADLAKDIRSKMTGHDHFRYAHDTRIPPSPILGMRLNLCGI